MNKDIIVMTIVLHGKEYMNELKTTVFTKESGVLILLNLAPESIVTITKKDSVCSYNFKGIKPIK
tara:strand:+ start:1398 stop:1592 length:195 start_codon:yes stop_codon:yes gene_type:complete